MANPAVQGFTVSQFRSALKYGGARQNLFQVVLHFPAGLPNVNVSESQQLSFMCKAASLPPEQMEAIAVPYFGRQIKVPGDRTFPEWQITVINDETFDLRNNFEAWSNALNGHYYNTRDPAAVTAGGDGVNQGYSSDASVLQFGKSGQIIKEYNMIGCWPSAVSQIDLGWDSNNQIEDFQVTMQYQWWTASNTDGDYQPFSS